MELGVTVWDKNNDKLYILIKNDDRLGNIFEVNLVDKSIRDLAYDIFDNELNYYCIENDDIQGTYVIL